MRSITVITVLSVFILCSNLSANDLVLLPIDWGAWGYDETLTGTNFAGTTIALISVAAGIAIYNASAISSDNPSKYCGLFGTVSGASITVYGGILLSSGDSRLMTVGSFITAAGITSFYYGVKSLARMRGKYLESKKLGLSIDPVIIGVERGKADVGIQISLTF